MDDVSLDVALSCVNKFVYEMYEKRFIMKKSLSEYEQRLLNDLHTAVIHAQYQEIIRQHFSTKK